MNLSTLFFSGGLQGLQDVIINGWLGPVFIVGIAAFAIIFIKDRAWMKLIGFVGIAAIVGVLVFAGDSFFGDKGVFKNEAEKIGSKVGSGQ